MAKILQSDGLYQQLQEQLAKLRPDLGIEIREELGGGLSGANVYLVDCQLDSGPRLGVLKLASAFQAEQESQGNARARESWLDSFMPEHFLQLGNPGDGNRVALLSSLARDRVEDCRTLRHALVESFFYGREHILFALAYAYRMEANRSWDAARLAPMRDCFQKPIRERLGDGWLKRWTTNQLPGPDHQALRLEDLSDRWPNPVAYLLNNDVWADDATSQIRIPWIISHGDLNPGNVLCPSYHRVIGQQLSSRDPQPSRLAEHISLIDMPYCGLAPFPFDMAFLASWLRFLLPDFDSRIRRDIVLDSYRAVIEEVRTGVRPGNVPVDGVRFVDCVSTILGQVRFAQSSMGADIEKAFLACLAAASLWQAIKLVDRAEPDPDARQKAIASFCLSSLALKALLGSRGERLTGPDFELWPDPGAANRPTWTEAAHSIGRRFEAMGTRPALLLVMGKQWAPYAQSPPESEIARLQQEPDQIMEALQSKPSPPSQARLAAIGCLPLAAVLDWSPFRHPRESIGRGLPSPRFLVPFKPGQELEKKAPEAVLYVHLRGSFEELPTVAIPRPARNASRKKLRDPLTRFSKSRSKLTVVYVGVPDGDLQETHDFLQEIWNNKLQALYIGQADDSLIDYLNEWNVDVVDGSIDDFLTACADVASTIQTTSPADKSRTLLVADMALDPEGGLVSRPSETLSVQISEEDHLAIDRAGHLIIEEDRLRFATLSRNPREFFIGNRVDLAEIQAGISIERDIFQAYREEVEQKLANKQPGVLMLPSRPGAGASTALRWLAHYFALVDHVPTLILEQGGNTAFEAIERLYARVGRSFLVVADPQDVPTDAMQGLATRCAPPRYPILFLTSRRVFRNAPTDDLPMMDVILSEREKADLVAQIGRHCPDVALSRLLASPTKSLFLLTLEAFGGQHITADRFVANLLDGVPRDSAQLVATVAFFSRYTHRPCALDFLQILMDLDHEALDREMEPFDQLLVLREGNGWSCRHEDLSRAILQYYLTGQVDRSDSWRYSLADFICELIGRCNGSQPGGDITADYIWGIFNPQLEADRGTGGERQGNSRLMNSADGLPENPMRSRVFRIATEAFPEHVPIISHYGKYLAEQEKKFVEAEDYLMRAYELEDTNVVIQHMLGKRYSDEIRELGRSNPPSGRSVESQQRLLDLADSAHYWFGQAREAEIGSEYNYTTPMQLDIYLIEDEFRRIGIKSAADDPKVLLQERISALLIHAERLAAEGLRFIPPTEEARRVFTQVRDRLHQLRGDLDTAIRCFQLHVQRLSGSHRATATVQLARFLLERGERHWHKDDQRRAAKDFEEGARLLSRVLQDPARRQDNIRLWFDCARFLRQWSRQDYLDHLHQLHEHNPTLDSSFLLMCLYFADAIDSHSTSAWRKCQEYQNESARWSANLGVRTFIREWLVEANITHGKELRIFPHHLIAKEEAGDTLAAPRSPGDRRVSLTGTVYKVASSTVAFLRLEPMGFEVFFKPRVQDRQYFKSDEGRTRVTCAIAFTYEKPIAYDVRRIEMVPGSKRGVFLESRPKTGRLLDDGQRWGRRIDLVKCVFRPEARSCLVEHQTRFGAHPPQSRGAPSLRGLGRTHKRWLKCALCAPSDPKGTANPSRPHHPARQAPSRAPSRADSVSVPAPLTASADGNGALFPPSPNLSRPRRK